MNSTLGSIVPLKMFASIIGGNKSFAENSPQGFLASNIYWGEPSFFEKNMARYKSQWKPL